MTIQETTPADSEQLLAFLQLEQVDRNIFRGSPGVWPPDRPSLYGGEVAAQALRAAANTVPDGRLPHSLHGYFLRRGDPDLPVVFMVERDRDGRSFSARRVAAMQNGEVIWDMACSFAEPVDGPVYEPPPRAGVAQPQSSPLAVHNFCPLLEIRVPPHPDGRAGKPEAVDRCWVKVVASVPDDPILHACLLTFSSDVCAGFGDLDIAGVPMFGPSVDHALWFQGAARADDWVLFDCTAVKVGGHRGLYTASAHDSAGTMVAMVAQEMLLRPQPPGDSGWVS